MSYRAMTWVMEIAKDEDGLYSDLDLSAGDLLTLVILASHADKDDNTCHPGITRLAKMTRSSERSVRDRLRALEEMGLLSTEPRFKNNRQTANEYALAVGDGKIGTRQILPPSDRAANPAGEGGKSCPLGAANSAPSPRQNLPGENPVSRNLVRENRVSEHAAADFLPEGEHGEGTREGAAETAAQQVEQQETPMTATALVELWNETLTAKGMGMFAVSPAVDRKLRAQIEKAVEEYSDRAWWRTVVDRVTDSEFLFGKNEDRAVIATLFWLTSKGARNALDAANGKYGFGKRKVVPVSITAPLKPLTREEIMELSGAKRLFDELAARNAKEAAELVDNF